MIDYAKNNPGVVVYLKPRRHRSAVISAEYCKRMNDPDHYLFNFKTYYILVNGDKQWISCKDLTKEEIIKWMELIRTQAGNTTGMRYRKLSHTDFPSIQGPWTPYTFRDPALNLAEFPNDELSKPAVVPRTATEDLIEMFKKQKLESLNEKRAE